MDLSVSPNLDEFCSTFTPFPNQALKLRCAENKVATFSDPPTTQEVTFVSSIQDVAPVFEQIFSFSQDSSRSSSSSQPTLILKSSVQSSVGHRRVWGHEPPSQPRLVFFAPFQPPPLPATSTSYILAFPSQYSYLTRSLFFQYNLQLPLLFAHLNQ